MQKETWWKQSPPAHHFTQLDIHFCALLCNQRKEQAHPESSSAPWVSLRCLQREPQMQMLRGVKGWDNLVSVASRWNTVLVAGAVSLPMYIWGAQLVAEVKPVFPILFLSYELKWVCSEKHWEKEFKLSFLSSMKSFPEKHLKKTKNLYSFQRSNERS